MATDNKTTVSSTESFFAQAGPSVIQGGFGAYNSIQGVGLTAAGGTLAAQQFQTAAASARSVAAYNAQLEEVATTRAIKAANRNLSRTIGEQQVKMAASGVSLTSKSFLAVANETLDVLSRELINFKSDSEQREQAILFQGEVEARALENRALQARFQGDVRAFGQAQQAGQQIAGLGTSVATLAAQSFGDAG